MKLVICTLREMDREDFWLSAKEISMQFNDEANKEKIRLAGQGIDFQFTPLLPEHWVDILKGNEVKVEQITKKGEEILDYVVTTYSLIPEEVN